jgi:redox-sensitive bicupin YhaK (pirin superfamily)
MMARGGKAMIEVRHARERGRSNVGWLDSWHSFSFSDYYDPRYMGFRALRVLNDDRVNPSAGFGAHSHRDMEIVSYVLSGELAHRDSMGNGSSMRPGDVQRMSAGSGVTHSEWNHSTSEPVHFLQIWLVPEQRGIAPSYEQRHFAPAQLKDRLCLVASHDGRDGSLTVHQDVALYVSKLGAGQELAYAVAPGRALWLHVARGTLALDGLTLGEGDGAALTEASALSVRAHDESELLLFDLA